LADDENTFNLAGISNADGQNSIKKNMQVLQNKKTSVLPKKSYWC